ncbi:MAG TPA: leucyl aminopeptidase [Thauera aminoaromatica]|jgi:leucyl aminopeptidase|uniref:Probable cytosol aminopeptidase n=2 Tax=Thauera aminoaromatica TaxID=164330 RepID=N6Z0D7_THASP|nr:MULTISPECIES: leucyl aminopeptidase [Thauera]MDA0234748.1 leucyl aminopeptidase [Pseudomonadota bacterium]OPZ06926.1 MAG: Cytosol aminopeptidase [Alphaproteobacteria bacterium ADurb.BinA305]ACR01387.1 Leucyl aminopeptidase [Thauera aminoaromatica]ENO87853.1 multifunctional aminopeptidase A [Thauera aminoaromatica S2]KIN88974.1 cytosol aminopeptidase [Thauera sp. SWB20]
MEFTIKTGSPAKLKTGLLVLGAFAEGRLPALSAAADGAAEGRLAALIKRGDLEDKAGATLLVHDLPGVHAERVLLVSLGKHDEFGDKAYRDALAAAAKAISAGPAKDAVVALADAELSGRDMAWRLQQAARILADGAYRFDALKSDKKTRKERGAKKLCLLVSCELGAELDTAVLQGHAIASGMALAKDLGNLPGNHCTPTHLAETAESLGKQYKFDVEVLERDDMEKLGMGSFLSVARGSHQPPKFIVMHYKGGKAKAKPVVLVGKGITFDTGGISLKPAAEMDEMKFDMCGAASVLGTFKAVAQMGLPINLVGLVPTTENMPGGGATKPGDVVTSMSGQTIEVLNTDAEGRLILCDALTYAERFKPECVIDIATLTGACVVALGKIPSGLLANDDELAAEILRRGTESGDRAWQLPLWDEYQELLKSNFADMGNIGGRYAGTITAACFLSRFAKAYKWAHLDIAGTAWVSGDAKGATGRPVPLLSSFLIGRARAHAA